MGSYNLFAYCSNNPVCRIDIAGAAYAGVLEFAEVAFIEIQKTTGTMSPVYSGLATSAVVDGPLPILDTVAVVGAAVITVGVFGYGVYQATQVVPSSTSKASEKIETNTNSVNDSKSSYHYWIAEIYNNVVTPLVPLTYSEDRAWVASENNLLCIDRRAAIAIVKFYPGAFWECAHRGGVDAGYLNHYHLSSAHKNHIWYYGD